MLEFVVVAEAEADARLVCDLADRIFREEGPDWIYEELLPNLRNWSGFDHPIYTRRPAIKAAMRKHHARPHYLGYVQGRPQGAACAESRKAILLAIERQKSHRIDALILAQQRRRRAKAQPHLSATRIQSLRRGSPPSLCVTHITTRSRTEEDSRRFDEPGL